VSTFQAIQVVHGSDAQPEQPGNMLPQTFVYFHMIPMSMTVQMQNMNVKLQNFFFHFKQIWVTVIANTDTSDAGGASQQRVLSCRIQTSFE